MAKANVVESREPRILYIDIETAPNLGYTWGKYEQNVIEFERETTLLGFAYCWNGDRKIHSLMLCDDPNYTPYQLDDAFLVNKAYELFDEADIVIAHNGDEFDIKKLNARFLQWGLPPYSPFKSIDTKKVLKKYFKLNSNKLQDASKFLGLGEKVRHEGFEMWLGCIAGNKRYWKQMRTYNVQDVALLRELYLYVRPWIKNHPNLGVIAGQVNVCPACLGEKLQRRGFQSTSTGRQQRYQCQACGSWSHSVQSERITTIK